MDGESADPLASAFAAPGAALDDSVVLGAGEKIIDFRYRTEAT